MITQRETLTAPQHHLRQELVAIALEWERRFGVAPAITCAISEYDAAILVGCSEADFTQCRKLHTAVSKGHDFIFNRNRYQVKANRPSGKPGSFVTWVPKVANYNWEYLIWILYNRMYEIEEAWLWTVEDYKARFDEIKRLTPALMRGSRSLR
jgi:hypothetical protein